METHKKRLNEEIIKLTCVSITEQQSKQGNNMKSTHSTINEYIEKQLQRIQQERDWANIEAELNHSHFITNLNNANNIHQHSLDWC